MIQFKFYSLGRLKLILSRLIKLHDYANCIITNQYFYFVIKNKHIIKLEITLIKGIINENGILSNINILQMYKSIKCIPAMLECLVEWNINQYLYIKAFNIKSQLNYKSKIKLLESDVTETSLQINDIIDVNIYGYKQSQICLKSILWILEKFAIITETINLKIENDKLFISSETDDIIGISEISIINKNNINENILNINTNKLINSLTNLEIFSDFGYMFINKHTLELCICSYLDSNAIFTIL